MGAKRLRVAAAATAIVAGLAVSAELAPDTTGPGRRSHPAEIVVTLRAVAIGSTVLLGRQTKTAGCKLGANPDRACSPGAYYSGLTKRTICSDTFRTSSVRHVTDATKHAVEVEYGLAPIAHGSALEIDHIVSLELGGSNDPANLYPERADAAPGYHVKDLLENKLHDMVCGGGIALRDARRQIATDWQKLYKRVFGVKPR
jgi:hypothetical protein